MCLYWIVLPSPFLYFHNRNISAIYQTYITRILPPHCMNRFSQDLCVVLHRRLKHKLYTCVQSYNQTGSKLLSKVCRSVWTIRSGCFRSAPRKKKSIFNSNETLSGCPHTLTAPPDSQVLALCVRLYFHRAVNESIFKQYCCTHTRVCMRVLVLCLFTWYTAFFCVFVCANTGRM